MTVACRLITERKDFFNTYFDSLQSIYWTKTPFIFDTHSFITQGETRIEVEIRKIRRGERENEEKRE